ncbi:MAG: cell envelope integrity protein TolA [Sphingopyxis sp.]|nr:cell envelope integrity protein TolA [Sphingopyxis sp.]
MTGLPKRIPAFAPPLAILCAALLAMPAATAAQGVTGDAYAGASWSLKRVLSANGTCTMIVNHGAMGLDAAGTHIVKESDGSGGVTSIEWSGNCNADGLINGRGTLFIDLDETGDYLSKRFIGTADRGVLTGAVGYHPYYDIEADEYGALGPDQPVTFVNGCNNWNGKWTDGCDTRRADRLRRDYMASRSAPAAKPAAPKPVAATPTKPAGPVAVAIPPSETNTLNDQQNAAAAAWLKADTEAKRVQAQKVADFERKQAEFNRQQTEYARQQEEYRAALAAQQAEVARIAKANADAQACYAGDKSRCNQAN